MAAVVLIRQVIPSYSSLMADENKFTCGWQTAGNVPDSFDWWLFGIISAAAAAIYYVYGNGIPIISGSLGKIIGSGAVTGGGTASAAAGALAILGLVAYYLLQPDGCIRSKPRSEDVCCSGIVEQTIDLRSAAIQWLAPYAIGPSFAFDVVIKTVYMHYVTQGADFITCSAAGAPMPRCVVKSKISCAARIGSTAGAAAGAVAGVFLGYLVGAAVASLSCGIFAWLCFIIAMVIAAIVAAATTYAGAMVDVGYIREESSPGSWATEP